MYRTASPVSGLQVRGQEARKATSHGDQDSVQQKTVRSQLVQLLCPSCKHIWLVLHDLPLYADCGMWSQLYSYGSTHRTLWLRLQSNQTTYGKLYALASNRFVLTLLSVIWPHQAPLLQQHYAQVAGFIFGDNVSANSNGAEKVAMTSPVISEKQKGSSEKVAMTSPVTAEMEGGKYVATCAEWLL